MIKIKVAEKKLNKVMKIGITKNQDCQEEIKQRYDKKQRRREKIKQRYDRNQGYQEKKYRYNKKIKVSKKTI